MRDSNNPEQEERLLEWSGRVLAGLPPGPVPLRPAGADLEPFLRRHGIGMALRQSLRTLPETPRGLPDVNREIAVEMARRHEFCRVMRVCRSRLSAPLLVFKGQALAYGLYPEPWLRPRGDVDVLVEQELAPDVFRVLESLGYGATLKVDGDLLMSQGSMYRTYSGVDHVWDIHWRISNRPAFADFPAYGDLMNGSVELRVDDTVFSTPNRVDSLLIACLHLVSHHAGDPRLIWLYDIHLLAATLDEAQRASFLRRIDDHPAAAAACREALDLTCRYLPADRTSGLRRALGGNTRQPGPQRAYLGRLLTDFRVHRSWNRLRFIRQHLFPSPDYMRRRFGLRHGWQLPVWYLLRMVRAVPKLLRRK